MSTLLFFPWLRVNSGFAVGDFELVVYVRDKEPFGESSRRQEQVDQVLSAFRERGENPVGKATLLKFQDKNLLDELEEEEASAAFVFGELVAVSGLSAREFFWPGAFQYCNRDLFQLRIQSFEGEVQGVAIRSRRRDGSTLNYVSLDAYRIHKPVHIAEPLQVQFDIRLLHSLISLQEDADDETWNQFYESIVNFNHASRESSTTPPHLELVFTSAAIERLLGMTGGKEASLAHAFVDALKPREDLKLGSCDRLTHEQIEQRGSDTVRELWIRDFYRLRGNLAHGQVDSKYPSVWSIEGLSP
jgi:hypothetical protein